MMKKLLALLMVLTMALCVAVAEEAEDPILATVDGEPILKSDAITMADRLYQNGAVETENDYDSAIRYLIEEKLLTAKIKELGFDVFTAEEEAKIAQEAADTWQSAIDEYVTYYATEGTDEEKATLKEAAVAFYQTTYDVSEESLLDDARESASYQKLENYFAEDYEPTEEEIRAVFEEYGALHQSYYASDISTYEMYTYYGYEIWYQPEGYRSVTHILLTVDDALLTAYTEAQAAYEEGQDDETADLEALKTAMDDAKAAVIASRQDTIDEIKQKLDGGAAFNDLIPEYSADKASDAEAATATEYHVHKDSVTFDAAFVQGAFADEMQAPGDISNPVVGSYGIHLVNYVSDIPGGLIEMSDSIRAQIVEYLKSVKLNAAYTQAIEELTPLHEIVRNEEAIAALTAPEATAEPAIEPTAEPVAAE